MNDDVDFATGTPTSGAKRSIGERIKTELAARREAEAGVVEVRHDSVPALTIWCRVPTSGEEIAELAQRAEKRAKNTGTSAVWFNRLLIARFTTAIEWHGERVCGDDGVEWTFASREFQDTLDATDAPTAVSAIYGSDAYVSVVASQLMAKAGFGDDGAVEVLDDPTTGR